MKIITRSTKLVKINQFCLDRIHYRHRRNAFHGQAIQPFHRGLRLMWKSPLLLSSCTIKLVLHNFSTRDRVVSRAISQDGR